MLGRLTVRLGKNRTGREVVLRLRRELIPDRKTWVAKEGEMWFYATPPGYRTEGDIIDEKLDGKD